MSADKRQLYDALVSARKSCQSCVGLKNPSSPNLDRFDSDEIGPWTLLAGDLDAEIMVVGQDWGDVQYFHDNEGRDKPGNQTTVKLEKLLHGIGVNISFSRQRSRNHGLFLTNAILCLKDGGMQAKVERQWFEKCGKPFLRRQVEIVSPKVVVALGKRAFNAILAAFDLPKQIFRSAVETEAGIELFTGTRLFAVYHCGARVLNTHRPFPKQQEDWKRVAAALRE